MNPADIDPSLCSGERTLESLDDGFSPPQPVTPETGTATPAAPGDAELALSTKSLF